MTESKFKIFLTNENGDSFYEESGNILTQGQPRAIENAPDGFQDIAIGFERNVRYMGLFRSFSFPLTFVKDGRSIIKHVFHKLGIEFRLFFILLVKRLHFTPTEYGFYYDDFYKGEIDMASCVQEEHRMTVNLMDGGIEAMIKANENVEYEIPLFGTDPIGILLDGQRLKNTAQFLITDGYIINDNSPFTHSHLVDLTEISKEVNAIGGVKAVPRTKVNQYAASIKNTQGWFLKATTQTMVSIDYDFILTRTANRFDLEPLLMRCHVQIRVIDKDGQMRVTSLFSTDQPWKLFNSDRIQGSVNIDLNVDDEVYFYTMVIPQDGRDSDINVKFHYSGEGLFRVTYFYRHPETAHNSISIATLCKKLVEKMTNGKYEADVSYLEKLKQYQITSGEALRRIENPKVKTSFAEFYSWLVSNEDVHFDIRDGKAYIGPLEEIFQLPATTGNPNNQENIDVGEVRNLRVTVAREFLFNRIKIGCPNQNYEDVNGRSEFNSMQYWSVPVTRDTKELDLSTTYREDGLGIEYARINFEGQITTDSAVDNETFVVYVSSSPSAAIPGLALYKPDRTANPYVTGVIDPTTVINVKLSPRHKIDRKKRYLGSCMELLDSQVMKMTSAEKNAELIVNYPSGSLVEKGDIVIATLAPRYFLPKYLEYETYKPIDLVDMMNEEDYRRHCVKLKWSGVNQAGFIMKVGCAPWDHEVQTHQLLSSPKNDLSKT